MVIGRIIAHAAVMELRGEVIIDAPPRAAWAVLGERFGQIGEWAVPITASSLEGEPRVGAVRDCHIAGFGPVKPGVIRERLIAFEPERMAFAYEAVEGMPKFVARAINRWSIHPRDQGGCEVRTHATLQLRGFFALFGFVLKRKMERDGARVLEELRHRVEHGRPHPRKVAVAAKQS